RDRMLPEVEKCRGSAIHFIVRARFVFLRSVYVARLGPGNQFFLSRVHKDKARDVLRIKCCKNSYVRSAQRMSDKNIRRQSPGVLQRCMEFVGDAETVPRRRAFWREAVACAIVGNRSRKVADFGLHTNPGLERPSRARLKHTR